MFPTFKIFAIYLIILSRYANTSPLGSETTTTTTPNIEEQVKQESTRIADDLKNIKHLSPDKDATALPLGSETTILTTTTLSLEEQLVKKEIAPFEDLLSEFKNNLKKQDETKGRILGKLEEVLKRAVKFELKGGIQGKVEKIIERAVKAEMKNEMLFKDQSGLEKEKDIKKKELFELKFPIRVRRVMDRIQSSFAEPSFCENCLQFGHKTTECQNPKAKKSHDAGANKLNRRAAYFEWVLREKGNTIEIAPLVAELKLEYKNHSLDGVENFEEYKKKFCHSLAVIHNIVDTKVHPDQVGKKLKNVNIFGKPLDSFALLLVKALDYSPDPDKPAYEYED